MLDELKPVMCITSFFLTEFQNSIYSGVQYGEYLNCCCFVFFSSNCVKHQFK